MDKKIFFFYDINNNTYYIVDEGGIHSYDQCTVVEEPYYYNIISGEPMLSRLSCWVLKGYSVVVNNNPESVHDEIEEVMKNHFNF